METIIGKVSSIIYESSTNDFKVFTLIQKAGIKIKVCCNINNLILGSTLEINGEYRNHYKYGLAFYANSYNYTHDNTESGLYYYLQAIAKWLGPVKTKALIDHFGVNLEEVIEKNYLELKKVNGIGEKIAFSIKEAWEENKKQKDIKVFLYSLGLTELKIKKILNFFGLDAENKIKENPWCLCEISGIGFSTCDSFAKKLRIDFNSIKRYNYFILHTLNIFRENGHLFLSLEELIDFFKKYNKTTSYPFEDITEQTILKSLKDLIQQKKIIIDYNKIYLINSYYEENESAIIINKIKETPFNYNLSDLNVEEIIKKYEEKNKIILAEEQKKAIELFIKEKILIITGSPGTGKTTILKILVQILKNKGISFTLLCPTGMAAKRMNLLTENETYTIHKYLGYDGKSWSFNEFNKCKTDVIIIDETSMLNQEIFYRLLSAIEYNTKLVFVGDVDQLPAVGPGNVLRELINSNLISTIFLTKIFRQGKYTNIILEAKKIKEGETDTNLFSTSFESELVYLREKKLDFINEIIIKIILDLKEKAKEKNISFQLITPRNDGPLSIKTLNKLLQEILNPPSEDKKELNLGYEILRVGDRVVVKKNNYQLNIFNGDIGKIIDITKDTLSIFIENKYEKSVVNIPIEIVDETLKLAYALTVHKCQGSEYDIVLLILVKEHGKLLLQRNLLYTALTRAKKKFILIGSQEAFKDAILNDKIQKRNTLLAERIQKWKENPNVSTLSLLSQYYKNNINELIGKENE